MPETLLKRLQSPRVEHPLEAEGLRVAWWMHVALAGFLAVLFRMWNLGTLPGVNGDEAWYGIVVGEILHGTSSPWFTPTGNPLNLFYVGPLLFLHLFFHPSFTILRIPAVVSGLAALVANVALCRKLFGERTAMISTLILAVLPVNIAYSRFGWDTSQTLLATVFVLYACAALARCGFDIEKSENLTGRKRRRPKFQNPQARRTKALVLGVVALAASLLVHPTNIFLTPMLVISGLTAWQLELRAFFSGPKAVLKGILCGALMIGLGVGAAIVGSKFTLAAWERLTTPSEFWHFGLNYARLFSGVTVYRYITGTCQVGFDAEPWIFNGSAYDMLGIMLVSAGLIMVVWWLYKARPKVELALAGGYAVSVLGFFLVAGPQSIAPHFERYSLCLIAPAVLLLARAGINVFENYKGAGSVIFAAVCWLLLLSFSTNYFWAMEASGGESHRSFRTGEVEPKQAAYDLIRYVAEQTGEKPVPVYACEWWSERPLNYLAMNNPDVVVRSLEPALTGDEAARVAALADLRTPGHWAWVVEFVNGETLPATTQFLRENDIPWRAMELINDPTGRPILILLKAGVGANFDPVPKPEPRKWGEIPAPEGYPD